MEVEIAFYAELTWGVSGIASPRSVRGIITVGATTLVVETIWMYGHLMQINQLSVSYVVAVASHDERF